MKNNGKAESLLWSGTSAMQQDRYVGLYIRKKQIALIHTDGTGMAAI
jgi:hypothetical protein